MVEEAPVFCGEHRLDQMVRQFVDRHGIFVDDAAMADHIAVAVEEGDGEIAAVAPVFLGFLEGRHGQHQHHRRAGGAERHRFAGQFKAELFPAADTKTSEKDGDFFPDFTQLEAEVPDGGIDPGVDAQQEVALPARSLKRPVSGR